MGQNFFVYNIHDLVHLSQVKLHGNLDRISCFSFENFLGQLKKMVRRPRNALTQVIRRLSEMDHVNSRPELCSQTAYRFEHKDGPVPESTSGEVHQFKVLSMDGIIVKPLKRDSCIRIGNLVVLVENFLIDGEIEFIAGKEYRYKEPFFMYPFDSRELGIYKVPSLSKKVK